jgi:hypothetical protein
MDQQHSHTIGQENIILQAAKKMPQRGSTIWSHCSCIPVRRRHLNELGAILTELIPRGLQRCAVPRHKVPLLVADYITSLHGTEEERERLKGLEQNGVGTYEKIPQVAQGEEITTIENIDRIAQTIDQYHKEIENICEQLTPTTPPVVKEQSKHEATTQL